MQTESLLHRHCRILLHAFVEAVILCKPLKTDNHNLLRTPFQGCAHFNGTHSVMGSSNMHEYIPGNVNTRDRLRRIQLLRHIYSNLY